MSAPDPVLEDVNLVFPKSRDVTVEEGIKLMGNLDLQRVFVKSKEFEKSWNEYHKIVKAEIESRTEIPEGTTHFGCLTIRRAFKRSWDQEKLEEARKKYSGKPFPFKIEYKEVAARTKVMREKAPKFMKYLEDMALTVKDQALSYTIDHKKLEESKLEETDGN